MLVLRYLLLNGVDPVPYSQDKFDESIIKLLRLPHDNIYNKLKPQNITYLSAIGILDSKNSEFLYDYLSTLTLDQFNQESVKVLDFIHGVVESIYISWDDVRNMVSRSAAKILINNRDKELAITDYPNADMLIPVYIAIEDLDYARTLKNWSLVKADYLLDTLDLTDKNQADLYLKIAIEKGELNPAGFLGMLTNRYVLNKYPNIYLRYEGNLINDHEILRLLVKYIKKIPYDCVTLMKVIAEDFNYTDFYVLEAEAIINACPDADWSELGEYFKQIDNQVLEHWWSERIDI